MNPQSSLHNQELSIALTTGALMSDSGMQFGDVHKAAKAMPSRSSLKRYIQDLATDTTILAYDDIIRNHSRLYLLCDKGAKKGVHAHFVKILCWWSKTDKTVKTFNLYCDDSDGRSSDGASAILHSLKQIFGAENNNALSGILYGQATDSSGGCTGYSFFNELTLLGLTAPREMYTFSFCNLHCVQLTLSNPIKHLIGEGGKDASTGMYPQNAMQLLHGIYNLQSQYEKGEWNSIWVHTVQVHGINLPTERDGQPKKIPCPILTRWWTVGATATFARDNWDKWCNTG